LKERGQAENEENGAQNESQNSNETINEMENIGRKEQMKKHLPTVKSDLAYLARKYALKGNELILCEIKSNICLVHNCLYSGCIRDRNFDLVVAGGN
jgi:hypothetical protein